MNTFADIFKKSFLQGFSSTEIGLKAVVMALATTFVLGLYIFIVYRVMTRKTFYSKEFNLSLVGVALITAAIIVTIQSSVVISLGMVGALSIVRFRTAIKNPLDLMFLFWAISVGIICGAGFAEFAVLLCLALTATLFVLDRFPLAKAPMLLVINSTDIDAENKLLPVIEKYAMHPVIKSRNLKSQALDLVIELRTEQGGELVKVLAAMDGITSVSLVSHDGEATF